MPMSNFVTLAFFFAISLAKNQLFTSKKAGVDFVIKFESNSLLERMIK